MKILVSGAHGFIGSHIVQHLLKAGSEVIALVSPWGSTRNLEADSCHPALTIVYGDITDPISLRNIPKHTVVIHAAARVADWGSSNLTEKVNVNGTWNLLRRAEELGVTRFVLISSVAVHRYTGFKNADPRSVPRDRHSLPYARSKIQAEDIVLTSHSLEGVVIRPGLWPFGPRDPQFSRILSALQKGRLPVVNSGKAVINTAYVENLVHGIELATYRPEAVGKTYVIADEGAPSWAQLFKNIADQVGCPTPQVSIPGWLASPAGIVMEKLFALVSPSTEPPLTGYRGQLMLRNVHFDITCTRRELGYHPKIPWQEGIRRTLEAVI
ncbi:MAG: hypothetical protein CMO31_07445 [Trueperaceae bacterium]|jgi:nucleoside-diphosphate-sugar epimerase|nr:hypothetical protein [Trueperaceae bacterium]|tara:strand:- start:4390 stop:5367 length:978 start_codon:yes stop_codon:yes gene_type:complete